jgi:hypothetical protein
MSPISVTKKVLPNYSTDNGYGIRVVEATPNRPKGYVVEIHFYDKNEAVEFATHLIRLLHQMAEAS